MMLVVKRKTSESEISVTFDKSEIAPDYRKKIKTPLPFLNHMIEHIVWRSGVNITVDCALDEFELAHLICEDVGMTVGKAFAKYAYENGIKGYGSACGIIDEARALAAVSFEDRSLFVFEGKERLPEQTEQMLSEDLLTFLDGFVQGARCTLHVDLSAGENGHHIWEAVYRAFGAALNDALTEKQGLNGTAGVAGRIVYEIEEV